MQAFRQAKRGEGLLNVCVAWVSHRNACKLGKCKRLTTLSYRLFVQAVQVFLFPCLILCFSGRDLLAKLMPSFYRAPGKRYVCPTFSITHSLSHLVDLIKMNPSLSTTPRASTLFFPLPDSTHKIDAIRERCVPVCRKTQVWPFNLRSNQAHIHPLLHRSITATT